MKRDMELVRKILFAMEEVPFDGEPMWPGIEGYEDQEITYHVMIMHEAGLIYAVDDSTEEARPGWGR